MRGKSKMSVLLGIRYLFWYLISIPVTWLLPICKERVILASNRGEGLSGNARYLFETWQKDGTYEVWAVTSRMDVYQELSGQYTHILFAFSWEAVKVSAQARFFILTHGFFHQRQDFERLPFARLPFKGNRLHLAFIHADPAAHAFLQIDLAGDCA